MLRTSVINASLISSVNCKSALLDSKTRSLFRLQSGWNEGFSCLHELFSERRPDYDLRDSFRKLTYPSRVLTIWNVALSFDLFSENSVDYKNSIHEVLKIQLILMYMP